MPQAPAGLGWGGILRLGLVQTALGAVVVLTTSTINRIMIVELALPALLPGLLVGLHYAIQVLRPWMGHGSDAGGRRTPWIIGGMAVLALGGIGAAGAVALMAAGALLLGLLAALAAFLLIGAGVSAAGTALLVLLTARVAPARRAAAASIVWIMMIAGFVVSTALAGRLLDPYSPGRLLAVATGICVLAFLLALLALRGLEPAALPRPAPAPAVPLPFRRALAEVWTEPVTRRFTLFVFVSMLAYSAQDLMLEPFAGQVFGLSLGQSTRLASLQHGGVLGGMVLVALAAGLVRSFRALQAWSVAGCVASACGMALLAFSGLAGGDWPLGLSFAGLGLANDAFAAAAIASMMQLAARGPREGLRIGLWGAAQAIAFGLGGVASTAALDLARLLLGAAPAAYGAVFLGNALLFLAAASLAAGLLRTECGAMTLRTSIRERDA
ncbi:MFS transporter [Roseicella frigidaeris]|uniref:MFS transporter n=1 Tax=Roseicella frigidaeris TaxID=2230885 RepID=A0A327MBZ8_9PROT|nr:MFS transporter [Roseicella frigidaeris]RAI57708.1 MFS transporter [Roseicella frigidaeris]